MIKCLLSSESALNSVLVDSVSASSPESCFQALLLLWHFTTVFAEVCVVR